MDKKIKVKAKKDFGYRRFITLPPGLNKKDYRALQAGKTVEVTEGFYKLAKNIIEQVKGGGKDGD